MRSSLLLFPCLAASVALAGPSSPARAGQVPIHLIFDLHMDPIPNGLPLAQKQALYQTWIANANWVLDQTEPLGAQVSFLSAGAFMELLVAEGSGGNGAALLRRLYASGAQIGSHHHNEHRIAAFNWPNLPPGATLAQITTSWQHNVDWVNSAIQTAWSGAPPEPLAAINCVKGAHVPSNETDFHALMQSFGFVVREGGVSEDYAAWYGHHIWNPFRPSTAGYMTEDLNGPFVEPTQGSVIGLAQIHHGIFQDMTVPAMKRQLLQLYVNWRHAHRNGLPEKVWTWGWGSHGSDFDAADPSRSALVEVLAWLETHLVHRTEPDGADVLRYATQRSAASAYVSWEAAHPGESSFTFNGSVVDWDEYPYLRSVAEELREFEHVADLSLGADVDAFHLRRGADDAVLVWRTSGTATYDLGAWVGPSARVVGLETGLHYGSGVGGPGASAVTVGQEPLLVTEAGGCPLPAAYCVGAPNSVGPGARMDWSGSTSVAANALTVIAGGCPPSAPGIFYFGPGTAQTPFGDGWRCVAGPAVRLSIVNADASGRAQRALDFAALPAGSIAPGAVRNFQFWYRNVAGPGGTGFNLSDALNVCFCP